MADKAFPWLSRLRAAVLALAVAAPAALSVAPHTAAAQQPPAEGQGAPVPTAPAAAAPAAATEPAPAAAPGAPAQTPTEQATDEAAADLANKNIASEAEALAGEDDRGFITRFLERNLSGAGRQVIINGFQGALSSRATFTELTIADDQGVWITLKNGAIQWNRSALFARRIDIQELSAEEILLPRLPQGDMTGPRPEARQFRLPELPVGVSIERLAVGRVTLGEAVIGQPAVVSVDGSMTLAGGEGTAKLAINRADGKRGVFALDAAYSNSTTNLKLDLTLDEDADGLFVNIVKLHDRPSVNARISGEGPLKDFAADLRLATNGQDRVTGRASASAQAGPDGTPGTGFRLELAGDVASLLPPSNRDFFGAQSQLSAEGWRGQNGRMSLPALMVQTEALNLTGSVTTNDRGAPQTVALQMKLGQDAGATTLPVRLPLRGKPTTVRSGNLQISYDQSKGDGWTLAGRLGELTQGDSRIGALSLDGGGQVLLDGGSLKKVLGRIGFDVAGLALAEKGIQAALGDRIAGDTQFDFTPGEQLNLSELSINGTDYGLHGTVRAGGLRSGITLTMDLEAAYRNIARLSDVAGRKLSGEAEGRLTGQYTVLGKGFDAKLSLNTRDLTVDQPQLDRLLGGQATITADARRDQTGILIRDLIVDAPRLDADIRGTLSSQAADLRANLRMSSLTDADPSVGGSVEAQAALTGASGSRALNVTGHAQDLAVGMAQLDSALKGRTDLQITAREQRGSFVIDALRLTNPQVQVDGAGNLVPGQINANLDLNVPDLSVMGRGLSGALTAKAIASEENGVRVLRMTGKGQELRLGQADVDGALTGTTDFTLTAEQSGDGAVTIRGLDLTNQQMQATVAGVLAKGRTDLTGSADIRSLASFGRGWRGALNLNGRVTEGADGRRIVDVTGTGHDLSLGKSATDGALKGETILRLRGSQLGDSFTIDEAHILNEQAEITAQGTYAKTGTDLTARANLKNLAALGMGWRGAFTADAKFADDGSGARRLTVDGTGRDLSLGQKNVDGMLAGETRLTVRGIERDGVFTIEQAQVDNPRAQVDATGTVGGGRTDVKGRVDLRDLSALGLGWRGSFAADGSLVDDGSGVRRLAVDGTANDLSLGQAQADAALAGPTRLMVRGSEQGGVLTIDEATVDNARLNAKASGTVGGGRTDVSADLRAASIAFLGRGFSGAVDAQGRLVEDRGARRITAQGVANGLRVGNEKADALLSGQTRFDLAATQAPSGTITVEKLDAQNGQVRINASGTPQSGINLDASLSDLALLVPGLPGPATAKGTIRQGANDYGIDIAATAPGGTRAQIAGTARRDFSSADIRVSGVSDAALANPLLRVRSIEGPVDFDLRLNGRPALENITGRVNLPNARLSDPKLGLRIEALNASADLRNGLIDVNATGAVADGGRLRIDGPVDLRGGSPRLDLRVSLDGVVLRDPNLYQTVAYGELTISGAPSEGPLVAGRIQLGTTEIRIPSTGMGGSKAIPDIIHLKDRPPVRATRAKAGLLPFPSADSRIAGMAAPPATPPQNPARLDLTIDAPNQIFVRGRGVDAELGGRIRLTGRANAVVPIGQLQLIRGRVDLLGKRFDMTEGLIELQGSLIPILRLVAQTQQDGIVTRIIIDGEVRDPEIKFESDPEMPQEEVLSQLLFGRGLDSISPLQAAQLANAIAVLAGKAGDGIVANLRNSVGLDDLDLATDDQGNVSVRAGKYLSRNVYTDVSVDDQGKSKINLNLDINEALRARGSVGSDGASTIGLYYERDY